MSDFGAVGWQYGYEEGVNDERKRIIAILEDKCECTEWMCAGAWSPEGQTVWCKWHMLIKEIEEKLNDGRS